MSTVPVITLSVCDGSKHSGKSEPIPHKDPSGLPKDYIIEQYEDAINKYIASVAKMNAEQIVNEVDKVTNKLEQVNQNCIHLYDNELKWVVDSRLEKMSEQLFRKGYKIFANYINKKFVPDYENCLKYSKETSKELKKCIKLSNSLFPHFTMICDC